MSGKWFYDQDGFFTRFERENEGANINADN